jgi:hypothetical protein
VPGGIPPSDLRVVVGRTVLTSTQGQKRRAAATLATVTGWGNTIQQPAGPGGGGSTIPTGVPPGSTPASATGGGDLHPLVTGGVPVNAAQAA